MSSQSNDESSEEVQSESDSLLPFFFVSFLRFRGRPTDLTFRFDDPCLEKHTMSKKKHNSDAKVEPEQRTFFGTTRDFLFADAFYKRSKSIETLNDRAVDSVKMSGWWAMGGGGEVLLM
jgi:hypothetical protein